MSVHSTNLFGRSLGGMKEVKQSSYKNLMPVVLLETLNVSLVLLNQTVSPTVMSRRRRVKSKWSKTKTKEGE